jgi:hypothetical protein
VTLDPLAPDPELLASAFRSAAARASAAGASSTLCIRPLYACDGSAQPVTLTLNSKRQVLCCVSGRCATRFTAQAWLPRHSLPIIVGKSPIWVRFTIDSDKRLSTRIVRPLSAVQALVLNVGLCAALIPFSGPAALAAATALILRSACLRWPDS